MSHLDEGTLHALLDGELDLHEVKEIQAHIGSCTACGTRLREVKEFHGESDRLVGLLEVPTVPSRRTGVPVDADHDPALAAEPLDDRAVPRPPSRLTPRTSGPAAEPPPLLLPENTQSSHLQFMRRMRWAALILVTVGAGYLGNQVRQSGTVPFYLGEPPSDSTDGSDAAAGAVLSSQEASAPAEPTLSADTAPKEEAKTAAVPKRVAPRAEPAPATEPATARSGLRSNQVVTAASAPPPGADSDEAAADTDLVADEAAAGEVALQPGRGEEAANEGLATPADVREEAAEALRKLDRERQAERADAATAALDANRRLEAEQRLRAQAAAPRSPEQRAQIYLRIGLDEAAKQLGRPVHVIEGMSPLFMGLAFGRNSPGADATRPVVRVVYQDSQGRLILLDQQRLRPGQSTSAPGSDPHWTAGEIALHLSGEVGPDVLRNWRARVR